MDLSIIIVNYNVKHFLEQCLISVRKALKDLEGEIIVVDNNSVDGSQQMIRDKFGDTVILIENRDNPGFSKANNQGIKIASGRHILLLNPDTVVEETTFRKCLDFVESHPDCGALGVKMIDGQGRFLPESKRSLPTAWVSFYKIFGLSTLFPRSRRFGKYHLTYLDKNKNHEIEVLSGAFMWLRKSVLDQIGLLDEIFFMYGEDIDLSYRVNLAGYKCWYFADTQIIHYKGESTKKGSLNYVKVFYQAMILFARKHFGGSRRHFFIGAVMMAVYFRALVAIFHRLVKKLGIPVMEGILVYGMMFGIKAYWEHYVKYIEGGQYPPEFITVYMPAYTAIFILFYWIAGAYKKPYKLRPLIVAPFLAFVAIATGTYMFGWVRNFSRAIVGLSAIFSMIIAIAVRGTINRREKGSFFFTEESRKRVVVAGEGKGLSRVIALIKGELEYPVNIVGVAGKGNLPADLADIEKLGGLNQLREIIQFYDISEVIFCNQTIPTEQILDIMMEIQDTGVDYKIVPPEADYIVGPQAIHTSRFSRKLHFNLQQREMRLQKQVFDVTSSLVLIGTFPLLFWLYKKPLEVLPRLFQVLTLKYHMVGYIHPEAEGLPAIKPGLLNMLDRVNGRVPMSKVNKEGLDKYYARTYSWDLDLEILLKGWRKIN